MISLEEIIKQNSLLPPIIDTSHQLLSHAAQNNRFSNNLPAVNRPNNFSLASSKRKQMTSITGVNTASALNGNSNSNNNNHYSAMQ